MFAIGIYCAIVGAFTFGILSGWFIGYWHATELGEWTPSIVPVHDRDLQALAPIISLPIVRLPRPMATSPSHIVFDQDGIT